MSEPEATDLLQFRPK